MALHEQSVGATDEWYTPPEIFDALGMRFAIDVAAPDSYILQPVKDPKTWVPADRFFTNQSLARDWGSGPVWMNPPFGARNGLVPWFTMMYFEPQGLGVVCWPDRGAARRSARQRTASHLDTTQKGRPIGGGLVRSDSTLVSVKTLAAHAVGYTPLAAAS